MKVGQIMQQRVFTLRPGDTLERAMRLICCYHISGLPVVDEGGQVLGILSEKDILQRMYPSYQELVDEPVRSRDFEDMEERYRDVSRISVEEAMTPRVLTVTPDTPVLEAASLMLRKRVRRLPVMAEGRLVGIVSMGDVHQAIFNRHFSCEWPMPGTVKEIARAFER